MSASLQLSRPPGSATGQRVDVAGGASPGVGMTALVQRAKRGNADALNLVLGGCYDYVAKIVHVKLGPRMRGVVGVEDILQETFLSAVTRISDFELRSEKSLVNWLSKLAENKITDAVGYHTAKKRDLGRHLPQGPPDRTEWGALEDVMVDQVPAPDELASRAEESARLERSLRALPRAYRDLIVLRHYANASWAEIAEATGRPTDAAARMMYGTAMVQLCKLMRQR